jgi:hypothetical protein
MIWFAYCFTISIRYLSVVIIPMILLTVAGVIEIHERFLRGRVPLLGLEITLLALAAYQIHHKLLWHSWRGFTDAFMWANHPLEVLLLFMAVFIAIIAILIFLHSPEFSFSRFRPRITSYDGNLFAGFLIGFLALTAIAAPVQQEITALHSSNWDTRHFAKQFVYEYRQTYQELATAIIEENLADASIIGANVFGLEYFVQQTVIDLFWGGKAIFPAFFQRENVTEGINLLKDYKTRLIVALNRENPLYNRFQNELSSQTYLFDVVRNNRYFRSVFSNEEFELYRILTYNSFSGFVDLDLVNSAGKTTIFGKLENSRPTANPSLVATLDLTNLKWNRAKCTIEFDYEVNSMTHLVKRVLDFPFADKFLRINVLRLPTENCSLGNLKFVFDLYDLVGAHLEMQVFQARPIGEEFLVTYDNDKNTWFVASKIGYEAF